MPVIPQFVVEYFLLGKTRSDAMERFTEDGGIGSDVWNAFARSPEAPVRLLMAPTSSATTMTVASAVHQQIKSYRRHEDNDRNERLQRERADVAPLDNFVSATLYLEELIRVVLPLTNWWHRTGMDRLGAQSLRAAIMQRLGASEGPASEVQLRPKVKESRTRQEAPPPRALQAAAVAALIGVFSIAQRTPQWAEQLADLDPKVARGPQPFVNWVRNNAAIIADEALREIELVWRKSPSDVLWRSLFLKKFQAQDRESAPLSLDLIQRVFLNRSAVLAEVEALATIKADAATRLFDVSCNTITWAVIDSGIDRAHPAFKDHGARQQSGSPPRSRVRATYDLTRIDRIKSLDLAMEKSGSTESENAIAELIAELAQLPGRHGLDPDFEHMARENLRIIAKELNRSVNPDWNLIEPLIRIDSDDVSRLVSDHGTHVAGTLGADWRSDLSTEQQPILRGVCPDINLYDLRVIHERNRESTEFALLAALEFVRFLNDRAGANGPVVAGVNISLSIPYDVKTYGCGATPVCVACDRLADSGVVVVAAAGNRGWNEEELSFGNFVFSSITDPGNAQRVITVGSTHRLKPHAHGVSYFSSRGPTGDGRLKPDLVAPGERIRGPVRGESDDELDGTSMAAPFVSGAAAMLLARHRELVGNSARVKEILCSSATDLGRERYFQGYGLVDVLRAMQSI